MTLTRRHFLFCAPAVILTPGLLMPVKPMLVLTPMQIWHANWRSGYTITAYSAADLAKMLNVLTNLNDANYYPPHVAMHKGEMQTLLATARRKA